MAEHFDDNRRKEEWIDPTPADSSGPDAGAGSDAPAVGSRPPATIGNDTLAVGSRPPATIGNDTLADANGTAADVGINTSADAGGLVTGVGIDEMAAGSGSGAGVEAVPEAATGAGAHTEAGAAASQEALEDAAGVVAHTEAGAAASPEEALEAAAGSVAIAEAGAAASPEEALEAAAGHATDTEEKVQTGSSGSISADGDNAPADNNIPDADGFIIEESTDTDAPGPVPASADGSGEAPSDGTWPGGGEASDEPFSESTRTKKSHIARTIGICVAAGIAIAAGCVYYHGYREYDGLFLPNTSINGMDVGGMSPEEVTSIVEKTDADKVITLTTMEGAEETITYADLAYRHVWADSAEDLQKRQNHYLWPVSYFQPQAFETGNGFEYSEDALRTCISSLDCIAGDGIRDPKDASIVRNDSKKAYEISPSDDGNRLDEGAVRTAVRDTVESGQTAIDLKRQGCYRMALVHTDDKSIQKAFKVIDDVQNEEISLYLSGSSVKLDKDEFFDWLEYDPATMKVSVDRAGIDAYTHRLAQDLDTYGKPRLFETTDGDTLYVGGGDDDTYGFIFAESDTGDVLEQAIPQGKSQEVEAIWRRTGRSITPDGDDIGNTYIEISIDDQHMWYYEDGELMLSTDVVTGMMTEERRSPTGVLYVIGKLTDYEMHGSYGSTHVNYAIMLNEDGVFIHDATWRSSFGGSIYVGSGSHGCINTPYDQVARLYDMVEDNTPVIIYDRNDM